jgi:hypothetical protein
MSLADDVSKVMEVVQATDIEPHTASAYRCKVGDEEVTIPYRVYFSEMSTNDLHRLATNQKPILAAIMTLHHSGYQREIWAEQLAAYPFTWTTPFMALLLGDYVREVLAVIERSVNSEWVPLFHEFAAKNPEWKRPLNHRILSYWDIYYRWQIPRLTDYPGYRVAERLGVWDKKTAPKLTRLRHIDSNN